VVVEAYTLHSHGPLHPIIPHWVMRLCGFTARQGQHLQFPAIAAEGECIRSNLLNSFLMLG
jgi:hypothetical protein